MTDAELQYKQSVTDANLHKEVLEKVKERIITHIRKLICQGDTVLKEVGMIKELHFPISMLSKVKSLNKPSISLNENFWLVLSRQIVKCSCHKVYIVKLGCDI